MPGIAKVVIDLALDREFDYSIPEPLRAHVFIGSRVLVPFGRTSRSGHVVALADSSERKDLKSLTSVVGKVPLLDEKMLKLARWVADYYCAPVEHGVRAVLPGAVRKSGARFKERLSVALAEPGAGSTVSEPLRKRSPMQAAVLDILRGETGGVFLADLVERAGTTTSVVRALEKKGLVKIESAGMTRDPFANRTVLPTQPLSLMPAQAAALDLVKKAVDDLSPPVVLLHGVTGSGKTEVYLQAIAHVLAAGRGAIVLVPEISLTPQTVERFRGRFGDSIAVLHSNLSEGERHDEWHRIREGKARIAIGARSAVFAPVRNLGLMVVDEEHDTSYKQDESPRYNARDVSVMRGRMDGCAVLLGSATPSLESWANARSGKYGLAVLSARVDHRKMPSMRIVDMRVEKEREGRANVFSRDLVEAVRTRLERAEQTILFLNRRGYSTSIVCPKCGFVAQCDHCSVAFTYHRQTENLRCHICGASRRVPATCPKCGDPAFKFAGTGTQRVENIVRQLFPRARVQRMDADVTTRKNSHEQILGDFKTGKTDILIGTQMIAKGLDFRSGERTFQLLTQVAGRAGRGDVPGEVIVQTCTPSHIAVQAACRMDLQGFYELEYEGRRELDYPPFAHLVCLTVKGRSENAVKFGIEAFARTIKPSLPEQTRFGGPCPAPLAKAKGFHRYQIVIRSRQVKAMVGVVKEKLGTFKWPPNVTCSVDVDAVSLM